MCRLVCTVHVVTKQEGFMMNSTAKLERCIKVYSLSHTSPKSYIADDVVSVNDPNITGYQTFELLTIEHPYGSPISQERNFSGIIKTGKVAGLKYDGKVVTLLKPE